jgi:ABC-2 type transport system permease protein
VGTPFITTLLPELWAPTLEYAGLATHFESVQRGVLDSRDIIYYLTFVVFFLFLTMRSVSSRKWKA